MARMRTQGRDGKDENSRPRCQDREVKAEMSRMRTHGRDGKDENSRLRLQG